MIRAIDHSNEHHKERAFSLIEKTGKTRIAIVGLSFKAGTDDLRNSPIVDVIEKLKGKGYEVKIFDENVALSRLVGRNKSFIEERLPHLCEMMTDDLKGMIRWAEVVVINNRHAAVDHFADGQDKHIIDLVRIRDLEARKGYDGICW